MTAIVGLVDRDGHVLVGGDSAASNDSLHMVIRNDPKVFTLPLHVNDPDVSKSYDTRIAMGYTTSFRFGQIVRFFLEPPAMEIGEDEEAYLVKKLVPAMREVLKAQGWLRTDSERISGGTVLVGMPPRGGKRGRVFCILDELQVAEARDVHDAVGCAWMIAVGSLHSTANLLPDARKRVQVALRASERWSAGVRGPFLIVSTDPTVEPEVVS